MSFFFLDDNESPVFSLAFGVYFALTFDEAAKSPSSGECINSITSSAASFNLEMADTKVEEEVVRLRWRAFAPSVIVAGKVGSRSIRAEGSGRVGGTRSERAVGGGRSMGVEGRGDFGRVRVCLIALPSWP